MIPVRQALKPAGISSTISENMCGSLWRLKIDVYKRQALDLIYDYSEEQAERVQKIESKVDRYEDELGTYLVKLNNKNLSERDSHSVSTMLHCIGDFERISDHAVNIMEMCIRDSDNIV